MFSIQRFGLILGLSFLTLPGVCANSVRAQILEVTSLDPVTDTSHSSSDEGNPGQLFAEFSSANEGITEQRFTDRPSANKNATGRIFADLYQLNQVLMIGTDMAPSPNEPQDTFDSEGTIPTTIPDSSALALSDVSQEGTTVPNSSALALSGTSPKGNSFPTANLGEKKRSSEPLGTLATERDASRLVVSPTLTEATANSDRSSSPTSEAGIGRQETDTSANREQIATAPEPNHPAETGNAVPESLPEGTPPFTESQALPETVSVPEPSVSIFAWLGLAAAGLISTRVRSRR